MRRTAYVSVLGLAVAALMVGCGSSTSTTVSVSVAPASIVEATTDSSVPFTATVAGTSNTAVTWSAKNVTVGAPTGAPTGTIGADGIYHAPATPGDYLVTATSAQDGTKSGSAAVHVVAAPAVASFIAAAPAIAAGGSTTLTATFTGGTATVDQGVGAITSGVPVTVSPAATMTYLITVSNAAGSTISEAVTVTVVDPPVAASLAAAKGTLTAGEATTLTATFSGGTGSIDNGVGAVASGTPVPVQPSATTTYTLTVTNGVGASATTSAAVTLVAAPAAAGLAVGNATITVGGSTTLTPTFSAGTGVINPGALAATSGTPVTVNPASTTTYTLTVTNAAGAVATTAGTVTVVPAPAVTGLAPAQGTITAGGSTTLTATFANGTGSMDHGVGAVSSGTAFTVNPSATTTYTLTVTNAAGTSTQTTSAVTVIAAPAVSSFSSGISTLYLGQSTSLTPVFANGTGVINPGAIAATSGTPVLVSPAAPTTYTLTVTNAVGSQDAASVTVSVDAQAFQISSFLATPAQVDFGQSTTLDWSTLGTATSLSLNGSSVLGSPASQSISPVRRQAYTLSGSNPLGGDSKVLKVAARGLDLLSGNVDGAGYADGNGTAARFNNVGGMAIDSHGNIFVADHDNSVIRMITPAGVVSTFAGTGGMGGEADGNGPAARFGSPFGIAVDSHDNLFVADRYGQTIRKITPAGDVTTVAGAPYAGSYLDGNGTAARFNTPDGIAVDSQDNLYVVDRYNHVVRFITPAGVVSTIAGTAGTTGSTNGDGSVALFNAPLAVAVDAADNVYIADDGNRLLRKIVPNAAKTVWTVSTLAGSLGAWGNTDGTGAAATFNTMWGLAADAAGNIWVTQYDQATVRKVTPAGVVTTPLGAPGLPGTSDGQGNASRFRDLVGIAVNRATGTLYLGEWDLGDIRKVDPALHVTRFAGLPYQNQPVDGSWASARFNQPMGMALDPAGNLYVADRNGYALRKVGVDGTVTTVAGALGFYGYADGQGSDAHFDWMTGIVRTADGGFVVSDAYNHTLRKISPTGFVSTFAGTPGVPGYLNGPGLSAKFDTPQQLAIDATGNIYVADAQNRVIRKVAPDGTVSLFAGTPNSFGRLDGAPGVGQMYYPTGLARDSHGNLVVGDQYNQSIRLVAPDGTLSTLAGSLVGNYGFMDGSATTALFRGPQGVAVDAADNIYVADTGNHAVRKIDGSGTVTTITGQPTIFGAKPGALPTAPLYSPLCVCVTPDGDVLVTTGNGVMQITAP